MDRQALVDPVHLFEQPPQQCRVVSACRRAENGTDFAQPQTHIPNKIVEFWAIPGDVRRRPLDLVEERHRLQQLLVREIHGTQTFRHAGSIRNRRASPSAGSDDGKVRAIVPTMTPIVIGVAGGSGSGKTTVVRRIVESLGDDHVTVLEHDRYYRDRNDLRFEERASLNYDHPDSLETDLMVAHVLALKAGQPIEAPVYDFARHARTSRTDRLMPRRALIVEGILIFADAALRRHMDIKVFVDTDDDTRVIRRLQRDVAERGRTMESVIDQYLSTVKPMYLEFVEPSKRYADLIVPVGGHNAVAVDLLLSLIRSVAGTPGMPA